MEDYNLKPDISIILPVYNAGVFLENTLLSILNQKFSNFELIIINDGSIDNSKSICEEYAKKDNRIVFINKHNEGICKARNLGISIAKGEFIYFCDHDDILNLELLYDNYHLCKEYNADWIKFGKIEHLYIEDSLIKKTESNFEFKVYNNKDMKNKIIELRIKGILTYVWDSLFKKSIILDNNIRFDEKFKLGNEDIDFCQRYINAANLLIVNNKNYYNHYTRLGISASSKFSNEKIDSHIYLANKSLSIYKDYNVDLNKYEIEYIYLIGRYLIFNVCQDLNKSNGLSIVEKEEILKEVKKIDLLKINNKFSWVKIYKLSRRICIYLLLFNKGYYKLLLNFDKYSRKFIYKVRLIRGFRIGVEK